VRSLVASPLNERVTIAANGPTQFVERDALDP
jgi:hypothetical protein